MTSGVPSPGNKQEKQWRRERLGKRGVPPDTKLTKSQIAKLEEMNGGWVVCGWHLGARGPLLRAQGLTYVLSRHGKVIPLY